MTVGCGINSAWSVMILRSQTVQALSVDHRVKSQILHVLCGRYGSAHDRRESNYALASSWKYACVVNNSYEYLQHASNVNDNEK